MLSTPMAEAKHKKTKKKKSPPAPISCTLGAASCEGTDRSELIIGTQGEDAIDAKGGNDHVRAKQGDDEVDGGDGADQIKGGPDNDTLNGGHDADNIKGGLGDDILNGENGDDTIKGGSGDDKLNGGPGKDKLLDRAGNDEDIVDANDPADDEKDVIVVADGDTNDTVNCGANDTVTIDIDPTDPQKRDQVNGTCTVTERPITAATASEVERATAEEDSDQ